jgi:quercetin dioxygenase-like cupin family protein
MDSIKEKIFVEDESIDWQPVAPGVKKKIMGYNQDLMIVKVVFEKGGIGSLHSHYHSQVSHIASGKFEVEINGKKKELSAGDGFYVPPNAVHGVVCLEAGMLIDAFSPMREDFLTGK